MARPRKHDLDLPANCYRKHGAIWCVRRGKWQRLGKTLPEAMRAYAKLLEADTPSGLGDLLDDYLSDARIRDLALRTLEQYESAVIRIRLAFREFRPEHVRPVDVAQYLDAMKQTPNMANRHRTVMLGAFRLALRRGLVETNPVAAVAPFRERKRDRYLTDGELAAIRAECSDRLRCVVDLCYLTAQRIGDVLLLTERQITEQGIEVDQQKTGKRLIIRWTDDLKAVVDRARALQKSRSLALFGDSNGKPWDYSAVRQSWNRATKRALVSDAHLHDLRAKSLTDARAQGLDPQRLAGHSTEAQTTRYLRGIERDVVDGPKMSDATGTR
jgi:integrase